MKRKCSQRLIALLLMLSLLLSVCPVALADTQALHAYCYGFRVTLDDSGKPTGFGFNMGAQFGTAPYDLSYSLTGGTTLSGTAVSGGYVSLPGNFASGVYTFTVNARDAAGAQSTASMKVTYSVSPDGTTFSQIVNTFVNPVVVKVNNISLSATTLTLRSNKDYTYLIHTVEPASAADRSVTWSSSDPVVADVDQNGLVKPHRAGNATITCTANDGSGVSASCEVTVVWSVVNLNISPSSVAIPVGGTYKLSPVFSPENAANQQVTWSSGNKAVIVVANDGTIMGVDTGVTTVSAVSAEDSSIIGTCVVTVGVPVGEVSVSPTSLGLTTGSSISLAAAVTPENATNKDLKWTSSDSLVASVDQNGRVSVWKAGTATITATAVDGSGKSASCVVTVTGEEVPQPTPTIGGSTTPPPSSATPTPAPMQPPTGYTMYVDTEDGGLNLRAAARQSAKRLLIIPRHAAVTVVTKGTTWSYVWYNGTYGYVMSKFLSSAIGPGSKPTDTPATNAPATQAPPASGQAAFVKTEKGGLNLREKPSQGAKRLLIIPENGNFTVVTYGNTWCYAYYNGTYGYVMTKFLRLATETETTTPPSTETTTPPPSTETTTPPADSGLYGLVVTEQGRLNLRTSKSTGAAITARIDPGKYVKVLEYGSTWCKVSYNNKTGYVMTKFLSFTGDVPSGGGSGSSGSSGSTPTTRPPESDSSTKYAQVVTEKGSLNLRRGMSSGATVITRIPQYAYVQVITTGVTWCYVSYNGSTGYVMTKYLSFAKLTPSSEGKQTAQVKSSGKLYKEASTASSVLAEVVSGDYVYLYTDNGTWAHVLYGGKAGYIKSECLKLPEGVASVSGIKVYKNWTYSYENNSNVLTTLSAGDKVKVLYCYGDTWWQVRLSNGIEGYVTTEGNVLKVSQW